MSVLEIVGELYGLPLDEFTAARDAKAKELKGTPEAATIKRLRKPATAAWVANLLVRHEPREVDQMLQVGCALREAQADLDAGQLRALTAQRRQLTAAMTTRARALARERGLHVSDDVAEQVERTLTAAMIDEVAAAALRSGLLIAPLSATGLGPVDADNAVALPEAIGHHPTAPAHGLRAVADPSPRAEHTDTVVGDDEAAEEQVARERAAREQAAEERAARRRAAEDALTAAEKEAAAARAAVDAADRLVEARRARVLQTESELDEQRRRVADLEGAAQRADEQLVEAEEAHGHAQNDASRAGEAVDRARQAVAELAARVADSDRERLS